LYSETFAGTFGRFTSDNASANNTKIWISNENYAKATAFINNANYATESWLTSPMIDAQYVSDLQLSFEQSINRYFGTIANEAMVYAKKEEDANWTKLTISEYPSTPNSGWSTFLETTINLNDYAGSKFQFAFVYKSSTQKAGGWEVKNVDVTTSNAIIPVSAVGWATYCSEFALDFSEVTDLTAYTAAKDGDAVKFTKVTGAVPANTGLLISGTTANVPVAAEGTGTSLLEGVLVDTEKTANSVFVLMKGDNGLGFYKNSNVFTVRAHSAYLPANEVSAARSFIALDEETTGIAELNAHNSEFIINNSDAIYNLNGQRVAQPTKGLYIVNGKKVIIK
jgi:hypothetical protein